MGAWPQYEVLKKLEGNGVVPTVSADSSGDYGCIVDALCDGGFTVIEFCFREESGIPARVTLDAIYETSRKHSGNVTVGCGTVQSAMRAEEAISSGAEFVVSNITDAGVIRVAHTNCVPVIAGARSDTEVAAARDAGAQAVKILLPPGSDEDKLAFFNGFRTLFPRMVFVPTGGIMPQNIGKFFKAGAPFAASGWMVPAGAVRDRAWSKIADAARQFVDAVEKARGGNVRGKGKGVILRG